MNKLKSFREIILSGGKIASAARVLFFAALFISASLTNAKADTTFVADLDGAQQVPAVATAGKGFGIVTLNDAETQIRFAAAFSGLSGNNTTGHLQFGAAGQAGAAIVDLVFGNNPGAANNSLNQVLTVTPLQVQQLRNGLWSFNIKSVNFPNGEIRGQLATCSPFVARLSGAQAIPATASTAAGVAKICLNKAENQMVLTFDYNNLSASPAEVDMRTALPGANSVQPLLQIAANQSVFSSPSSSFWNFDANQVALLKKGLLYLRVGNAANPNGEIRGQFKPLNKAADFDGDSRADISVFRPSNGVWYSLDSTNNQFKAVQFGTSEDLLAPADFDGDGLTDKAVWRPSSGTFYVLRSSDNQVQTQQWGTNGDVPVAADYDADGKADFAVYRRGSDSVPQSYYHILGSNGNKIRSVQWGQDPDSPIVGDYDGDRVADLSVVRVTNETPSRFVYYTLLSTNNQLKIVQWGINGEHTVVAGDFDGDAKADYTAFQNAGASSPLGTWWTLGSAAGVTNANWGLASDKRVAADYDGDGKHDLAVYRSGVWYILPSSTGTLRSIQFGAATDQPAMRNNF